MPKFSVKKPFTVFVAVVAILVLGVVAYTKMTPDLMPNMDLPYVLVITTYPGATPEEVELTVTRPLEQSFATLDKIKSVNSVSNENYSLISLEFSDDVNMDTISVDILQNVDMISGYWDDMVGTPYILKINPSMLPVAVTAVGMEGMDTAELSDFIDEEIIPKLEGIEGVASIDASGLVDTQVHVVINQDKIDVVNAQITDALDKEFADAQAELEDGKAQIADGKAGIATGKRELDKGKEELSSQMADAQAQLDSGSLGLLEMKLQLQDQLAALQQQKGELKLEDQLAALQQQKADLEASKPTLVSVQAQIAQLDEAQKEFDAAIEQINENGFLTDEQKEQYINGIINSAEYQGVQAGYAAIDEGLKAFGMTRQELAAVNIDGTLTQLDAGIAQLETGISQMNYGIAQLESALAQLEAGGIELSDAQKLLDEQKTLAIFQLADASTQLLLGESQLESASSALDEGMEQFEDAKEAAYKKTDMNNIITMDMVSGILMAQNFAMPAGYVEQDGISYMVNVGDAITDEEQIAGLLLMDLGMDGVDPVYLSDVADVFISNNAGDVYANID
ncbi:MAG: efflux RND transporter permease subunit, partial [Lachnospiraceae bacterium]|nr:efflux RND transporter permease subunit [Lachnospiraceae bacterium]